jgi:hypothetical protein
MISAIALISLLAFVKQNPKIAARGLDGIAHW